MSNVTRISNLNKEQIADLVSNLQDAKEIVIDHSPNRGGIWALLPVDGDKEQWFCVLEVGENSSINWKTLPSMPNVPS